MKTRLMKKSMACAAVAIVSVAYGCLDPSARQCRSPDDCAGPLRLPASETRCDDDGVCRPKQTGSGFDAGVPAPPCTSTAQCVAANGGRAATCQDEQCVPIVDGVVVTDVTDNYEHGNPVVIGFIVAVTDQEGFRSAEIQTWIDTVKFAASQWHGAAGGGIEVPGKPERRPVVAAFCDSQDDPTRVEQCVRAFAKMHAPAIVVRAISDASAALPAAGDSKMLLYCTDCEPTGLSQQGRDGLLWIGVPPLDNQTAIRVKWGELLEARVREDVPSGPIKVVYVSNSEIAYSAQFKNELKFSSPIESFDVQFGKVDWRSVAQQILQRRPHIIVTGDIGFDFHARLLPELEARWGGGRRPLYFLSESESYDVPLQRSIGTNLALRKRITGSWISPQSEEVEINWQEFEQAFHDDTRFGGYYPGGTASGFESYYVMSFAAAAAITSATTTPRLTGFDISAGMKRLVGPPENAIDFQVGFITNGLDILKAGGAIDARGVYTDLDFDPATGRLTTGAGIWCPAISPWGTKVEEVWRYDVVAKQTIGSPDFSVCNF